jgi:dual specificity phosphatase 3
VDTEAMDIEAMDIEAMDDDAMDNEAVDRDQVVDRTTREELDWWRQPGRVGDDLYVSGDLPPGRDRALTHLGAWRDLGIGVIVDCREEYSDEEFVAEHAPEIVYLHAGTHDAGGGQDPGWFERTVSALRGVVAAGSGAVMVHCHMGVNRGPSMALAVLLDRGWDPVDALDAILVARPIAAVAYAESALRWHHGRLGSDPIDLEVDLDRVAEWFDRNGVDAARSIGRIRSAE